MIYRITCWLIFVVLICSCNTKTYRHDNEISFLCQEHKNVLLSELGIIDFEWDSLYVFYPFTGVWGNDLDEMSDDLGIRLNHLDRKNIGNEFSVLVFLKNGEYVSQIDIPTNVLTLEDVYDSSHVLWLTGYHNFTFHNKKSMIVLTDNIDTCKGYIINDYNR